MNRLIPLASNLAQRQEGVSRVDTRIAVKSHDRDHDHPPSGPPPKGPQPLISNPKPDCKRPEHPTAEPREPLDPRAHPHRRLVPGRLRMPRATQRRRPGRTSR
jgi:hypothetical protein